MILLIDNYDSFSYNLYQMLGSIEGDIRVVRNDALSLRKIRELAPDGMVISPGPGRPEDAGICIQAVRELGAELPILGVCLGHQAICMAYGARVGYAARLMHGKSSVASVLPGYEGTGLFAGLPTELRVARYHSLSVEEASLPGCLAATSRAEDGEIMSVRHTEHPVFGLQFHPESILTPQGSTLLRNFVELSRRWRSGHGDTPRQNM